MHRPRMYMKIDEIRILDVTADPGDKFEIEVQDRGNLGKVVYVHINGITLLRICRVQELKSDTGKFVFVIKKAMEMLENEEDHEKIFNYLQDSFDDTSDEPLPDYDAEIEGKPFRVEESSSYRDSMNDAGRGHLLS